MLVVYALTTVWLSGFENVEGPVEDDDEPGKEYVDGYSEDDVETVEYPGDVDAADGVP